MNRRMHSGRRFIAVAAVTGVALTGTALLGPSASSAALAGDCAAPFPVSDLTDGQAVTGLTVTKGTEPGGFTGEVLGVLDNGIAPGLDMVMMRLTSTEIDRVGGIWQGMSGSPVYAEDGRLIGAVAYGLAWGPSPVAGVTPFEDMDDYLAPKAAAKKIKVSAAEAKALAEGSPLTQQQARAGFEQLEMPMTVSGVSQRRLDAKPKKRPYLTGAVQAANGAGGNADSDPSDLVAGGNIGATVTYGDVLMGGVGTVTSVCADELVGFGHPFTYSGKTTMGLHPASAVYIQEDPVSAAFKVANIGSVAGTITDDRGTGISGKVGVTPATIKITSDATYRDRNRTGETYVELPAYAPDATIYQLWGNEDRVFDAWSAGGALQSWTITGTRPNGSRFTLKDGDRYASQYDISAESSWDVADQVWELSTIPGVTLKTVKVTTSMKDDASTWSLARIEQRKGGKWGTVKNRVDTRAGAMLRMRAILTDGKTEKKLFWTYRVPRKLAQGWASLTVLGGGSDYSWSGGTPSIGSVLKSARTGLRNDELMWEMRGSGVGGSVRQDHTNKAERRVIEGERYLNVRVRP